MRNAESMCRPALALLVALAAVLAGCSRTIDSDKAEETILSGAGQRTGSTIRSVDCPTDQTAKRGSTFTCRVVAADGMSGDVRATVADDSGRVMLRVPFRNTRATERSMATMLTRQTGRPVSVDCPDIIARRKGVVFECDTSSGATRGRVRAKQTNDQAKVRYRQVRAR